MSFTYGFFDSLNKDRLYDAEQFSSFLDGIVYDGIYAAVGNKFFVAAFKGMTVTVDTGRAWFDHVWALNTTKMALTLDPADNVYSRIDAIVLEINKNDRKSYIKVLKGTPSAIPSRPKMTKTVMVKQYPLAYITIPIRASSISQNNITYMVDTSETPLCSALSLAGIPSGGSTGMVLAKTSSESGAVGWYNIDRLPSDTWYLPPGVSEADIVAAFKFRNANSLADALNSVNKSERFTLSKDNSVSWSGSQGILIPQGPDVGLWNSQIQNSAIRSVIVKYSGIASGSNTARLCTVNLKDRDNQTTLHAKFGGFFYNVTGGGEETEIETLKPGVEIGVNYNTTYYTTNSVASNTGSGIIGYNISKSSPSMFFNGSKVALSSYDPKIDDRKIEMTHIYNAETTETPPLIGNTHDDYIKPAYAQYYIHAIVFLKRTLSDAEHGRFYNLMNNI